MAKVWQELGDGWVLEAVEPGQVPEEVRGALPVPASVPGTVTTDLLAAGLIPDPYLDENERRLDWIGRQAWRYRCDFTASAQLGTVSELAFDGLDTLARIELNGHELASTANMHRRYRFDVSDRLVDGTNELVVEFASPWGPSEQAAADGWPDVYSPHTYIRKMACNFGWDWGPILVTAGIWRSVTPRAADDRPRSARCDRRLTVRRRGTRPRSRSTSLGPGERASSSRRGRTIEARAVAAGRAAVRTGSSVDVDVLELWWPVGLGEQRAVRRSVRLSRGRRRRDAWRDASASAVVRLDTTPDADGIAVRARRQRACRSRSAA